MSASPSPYHSSINDPERLASLMARVVTESTQALVICAVAEHERPILQVNREFARLTGFAEATVIGQRLSAFLRPPGGQFEWERVDAVMLGTNAWRKTLPATRKDGTVFWADLHIYPLTDQKNTITHWVGVITDVTDHLELHDALRQSEAQHRLLAENIKDLITVYRADGLCVFASSSCREMLGYEPEEIIGKPLRRFLHPDDQASARLVFEGHFEGRNESVLVHSVRRKDGTYLSAETSSKTRRDPATDLPKEVVSTTRDITKRIHAEGKLKSMHKLLDSVYEAVPIGLCLLDESSQVVQCNRAFARLLGAEPAALAGRTASSILPERELFRAVVAQGTPCECDCMNSQQELFPAEITVVSLEPMENGTRQLVTLADLRERKKIETRLREATQLESLGTLAGGIAHDFNNMLAIVLGYASLLRDAASDPGRLAHYADTIIDAGRRGAEVVRQLQLFASTQDADLAPTDINLLLEEAVARTTANWPENIKVERNFGGATNTTLTVDAIQLAQAIQKLMQNAKDAMIGGGTVTVRTSEVRQSTFVPGGTATDSKHYLRISIEDTGRGMDAATRARMFEPFFTRHKNPDVGGLGLAVVYGIMRAHRGLIEVDSTPGHGTAVHLLFPRAIVQPEPVATQPDEPSTTENERRTLLLVEDEQDIGALWLEILPSNGWRVLWARDGGEALRLFRAHREEIALVFTDIGLPVLDGWQVAEAIRAEMPTMPLLIASGAFRPGDRQRGLAEPASYLSKPYVPSKVLKQINAMLAS